MKSEYKSSIISGILGGLVVFMFGGWSIAVLGILFGVIVGLSAGSRADHNAGLKKLFMQSLSPAGAGALAFVGLSLFQNFVVAPAAGRESSLYIVVIIANLIGGLGFALLAAMTTALHGLTPRNEQMGKLILLAALVAAFPIVDQFTGLRWSAQIIFALIFVILGLGLNIVVGFAGLLDLGYAAFFAIGAYTTGILSSPQHNIFLNFWLVIWIAAAMAAIWGLLLGAPTLPLRGDYLAIVTLGFGEIIPVIFRNLISVTIKEPITCWIWPAIVRLFGGNASGIQCIVLANEMDLTAGEKGINPIGRPVLPLIAPGEPFSIGLLVKLVLMFAALALVVAFFVRAWRIEKRIMGSSLGFVGVLIAILLIFVPIPRSGFAPVDFILDIIQPGEFQSNNPIPWYFLIIGIILLSIFIISRLRDSRLGRAWMAIREDELAASQMGIDPVRTKLLAFSMGATFSGFAGAFYAAYIRGIFPSVFDFSASIMILCVVILGGLGSINGVIVGGLIIMTADRLFLPALKDLLTGLMDNTILPGLASVPAVQAAVAQNANPILYRFLLFGLTLVIMMAIRPEGLIPSAQVRAELHATEEPVIIEIEKAAEA